MDRAHLNRYFNGMYAKDQPFLVWDCKVYTGFESRGHLRLGKYEAYKKNKENKWGDVIGKQPVYTHHKPKGIYKLLKGIMKWDPAIYMWLEPLDEKEADEFRSVFPFAKELTKDETV